MGDRGRRCSSVEGVTPPRASGGGWHGGGRGHSGVAGATKSLRERRRRRRCGCGKSRSLHEMRRSKDGRSRGPVSSASKVSCSPLGVPMSINVHARVSYMCPDSRLLCAHWTLHSAHWRHTAVLQLYSADTARRHLIAHVMVVKRLRLRPPSHAYV